jgi:pyruvate kinase
MTFASLPRQKTKIVCTIGPACDTPEMMEKMILAGMNVARLNFSHGEFAGHREIIGRIRRASESTGRRVAIMADLPGPKIRIGRIAPEPVELKQGEGIVLTTAEVVGDNRRVTVNFDPLPQVVKEGDALFLNDGLIELEVERIEGADVRCRVQVGGELSSRKGLNLPGIDLGMSAFTVRDRECLEFALGEGVDAVSQSFVGRAEDITRLREHAVSLGHRPFVIAKIERAGALEHIDEIIDESDGIMIARSRPVITATQMLESMTTSRRPTRAEATDVANAVLDGTDCVMLSGESAVGKFPVEAVEMLSSIAAETEKYRPGYRLKEILDTYERGENVDRVDLVALSSYTARNVTRFRLPVWIAAVSPHEETCRNLQFSFGVHALRETRNPDSWNPYAREWIARHGLEGDLAIMTEGPSPENPEANHRMELIEL